MPGDRSARRRAPAKCPPGRAPPTPAAASPVRPLSSSEGASDGRRPPARLELARPPSSASGSPREPREVRTALLTVGVPALLRLLAGVEEQVRVVGELLDPRESVFGRVE